MTCRILQKRAMRRTVGEYDEREGYTPGRAQVNDLLPVCGLMCEMSANREGLRETSACARRPFAGVIRLVDVDVVCGVVVGEQEASTPLSATYHCGCGR